MTGTDRESGAEPEAASGGRAASRVVAVALGLLVLLLIAGFVTPALLQSRDDACAIQCADRLFQLYRAAHAHALEQGSFPVAKGPEPAALQWLDGLLDSQSGPRLVPALLKCPAGEALLGEFAEDGACILEEVDLAWTARELRPDGPAETLAACPVRHGSDGRYVLVVMTDGSVREVEDLPESGLPEGLVRVGPVTAPSDRGRDRARTGDGHR